VGLEIVQCFTSLIGLATAEHVKPAAGLETVGFA